MTKPLSRPDVIVNARRLGPPRLTAPDRQALASVEDPALRKVLGEILLASQDNQANFDEIREWFPVQPEDVANSLRNQAEGPENEGEADQKGFWARWLSGSRVVQSIRGYFDAFATHFLQMKVEGEVPANLHKAWIDLFENDEVDSAGVAFGVQAGPHSRYEYLLRYNSVTGQIESAWVPTATLQKKGNLISSSGVEQPTPVSVGEDGEILVADSTAFAGLRWKTPKEAAAEGPAGRAAGLRYTWLTNTEATDPGAGKIKTTAGKTLVRVSETDGDGNGIAALIATWDDSTTTKRGYLTVRQTSNPKRFIVWAITAANVDEGTFDKLTTEVVSEGEAIENNAEVEVEFSRTGDLGEKGGTGEKGEKGETGSNAIACRLATLAALPANTRTGNTLEANANGALPSIDNVAPAVGDVVLVRNEATGKNNGAYKIESLGAVGSKWKMTRIPQMETSAQCVAGMLFTISEGNAAGDNSVQMLTTNAPITLNTTALSFSWPVVRVPVNELIEWIEGSSTTGSVFASATAASLRRNGEEAFFAALEAVNPVGGKEPSVRANISGVQKTIFDFNGKSNFLQLDALRKERDFGIVTALPAEPVAGDRCCFQASKTNGVYWDLRYDGEGEFPWKKVGGPPLYAASNTSRALTNKTAYESLPTDPLSIAAPLKGDYDIRIETEIALPGAAAGQFGYVSYAIGATAASDNWGAAYQLAGNATSVNAVTKMTRQTGVAAAASIVEKARTGGNYEVNYRLRRLTVDPIRVG